MKLNISYDGQTISVADGESITLHCEGLRARGNIVVKAVSDTEVEMQTCTIANVKNFAETVSFTMPSGYTFEDFVGSEYDTSGGKVWIQEWIGTDIKSVYYGDYPVYNRDSGTGADSTTVASGEFRYIGESATQTLTVINSNNTAETANFTMPMGWTFEQFIGSEYDTSGGKFTIDTPTVMYNGYYLSGNSAGSGDEIGYYGVASGTFYYKGEAAQYTLSGTWMFNKTINAEDLIVQGIFFTSKDIAHRQIASEYGGVEYQRDDNYAENSVYDDGVWEDEAYRTITFDGTQTVSKEFYEWFTANATISPTDNG